jgi:hypothetical protein
MGIFNHLSICFDLLIGLEVGEYVVELGKFCGV